MVSEPFWDNVYTTVVCNDVYSKIFCNIIFPNPQAKLIKIIESLPLRLSEVQPIYCLEETWHFNNFRIIKYNVQVIWSQHKWRTGVNSENQAFKALNFLPYTEWTSVENKMSEATKTDTFSEKFQTAFDTPRHFRKIIFQIFPDEPSLKPCIMNQNLHYNFLDWKWSPLSPFGCFSKIHPFW